MERNSLLFVLSTLLIIIFPVAFSLDFTSPIPQHKAEVQTWFNGIVKPLSARKGTLDPELEAAEAGQPKIIRVRKDGTGDFKTVTDAVKSIPPNNDKRIIVFIGGGEYFEKIKLERGVNFVTFYGDPKDMPTLVFNGTKLKYNILESGTLIVDGNYFVAANLHIKNSAPMPDGKMKDAQASAMRIGGDKAAFYNVRFYGFQDTLCDDKGQHFFKDCYIEGTVDYIFGNGKSIYVNCELYTIGMPKNPVQWITAQGRETPDGDTGYFFLHCAITGTGDKNVMLGRAWKSHAKVVFAYSSLSKVVAEKAWDSYNQDESNIYFAELANTGEGLDLADLAGRVPFLKTIKPAEHKPFLSLSFIEANKWLLPPPKV